MKKHFFLRTLCLVLSLLLLALPLASCGGEDTSSGGSGQGDSGTGGGTGDAHTHTLTAVDEIAPTCEKEGVKAHYHCNGCNKDFLDAAGKQEVKIVPNASVEKCQKKAVRLVSAERHQKKNVCSAPAEMRQRKAVQSVRAELRQTEAAQSGNARQWQKADAQNGNVPFQQKKAACSAITRLHRRIVRRKSLQHRENAGMHARRFMCARHPARSFTTRWNGRNTVIAQRDMSRNQSDPDAPARQKPG